MAQITEPLLMQMIRNGSLKRVITDRVERLTGERPLHLLFRIDAVDQLARTTDLKVQVYREGFSGFAFFIRLGLSPDTPMREMSNQFQLVAEEVARRMTGGADLNKVVAYEETLLLADAIAEIYDQKKALVKITGRFECCCCDEPTHGEIMCDGCGSFYCEDCYSMWPHECCDYVSDWEQELAIDPALYDAPDWNNPVQPRLAKETTLTPWGQEMLTFAQQERALLAERDNFDQVLERLKQDLRELHMNAVPDRSPKSQVVSTPYPFGLTAYATNPTITTTTKITRTSATAATSATVHPLWHSLTSNTTLPEDWIKKFLARKSEDP